MSSIKIVQRNKPFSHSPGMQFLIPGTTSSVQIYPAKLILTDELHHTICEVHVPIKGPMRDFTAVQDLEKKHIRIFGNVESKYTLIEITHGGDTIHIQGKKGPEVIAQFSKTIKIEEAYTPKSIPRLFLGVTKQQDLDLIRRRKDLKEQLPILFHIAQLLPLRGYKAQSGTAKLLAPIKRAMKNKDRLELRNTLETFLQVAFNTGLTPRLFDGDYQGVIAKNSKIKEEDTSLYLLQELKELIFAMLFQKCNETLVFLPCILPSFVSGKMINIQDEGITVHFEWTKGKLRRVQLKLDKKQSLAIETKSHLKTFRFNRKTYSLGEKIVFPKGCHTLDRFQK